MGIKEQFSRRRFLKTIGLVLTLFGGATPVQSVIAGAIEEGPPVIRRDPAKLKRLLEGMESKGYQYWSVPRKDGEFLHLLVKATRARNVLELGTSHGFSAIWMGLGLEETGGRLTTVEIDRERYDCFADHQTHAMIDKKTCSYFCCRVDLNPCEQARTIRKKSWDDRDAGVPENMVNSMDENRMKSGIGKYDLKTVPCSRISLENCLKVLFYIPPEAHVLSLLYIKSRTNCAIILDADQPAIRPSADDRRLYGERFSRQHH